MMEALPLLEDHAATLLALATAVVLLLLLARKLVGRRQSARTIDASAGGMEAPAAGAPTRPVAVAQKASLPPAKDSIEVEEADPLTEAAVYLEFGYLDHAAQILRKYVDSPAGAMNLNALRKLLHVYLQQERIDDYAEVLDRIAAIRAEPDFLQKSVLAGLAVDHDNLQLRVLAESQLGLGPERLAKLLGTDTDWTDEPPANVVQAEASPAGTAGGAEEVAEKPVPAGDGRPVRRIEALVVGGVRLAASFTMEEKAMLRVFSHPAHEAKLHRGEARMHRNAGNLEAACEALRRAIAAYPRALASYVDLLWILHRRRRLDEFAVTLWHLYAALKGAGRAVRERFLGMGLALGQNQILEALVQVHDTARLDEVGRQFGLIPESAVPAQGEKLIDVEDALDGLAALEKNPDLLAEINAYMEFGQVDLAMDALEAAIVANPADTWLYPVLFHLYETMDAVERLDDLPVKIRKLGQRLPDEIAPTMLGLQQRMQQKLQAQDRRHAREKK